MERLMDKDTLANKEIMRLNLIRHIQQNRERDILALRNFDACYDLAALAESAANAAAEEPIARTTQVDGRLFVILDGNGEDLKRVYRTLRQRGYKTLHRYFSQNNDYVSLEYKTDDSSLAGEVIVDFALPPGGGVFPTESELDAEA